MKLSQDLPDSLGVGPISAGQSSVTHRCDNETHPNGIVHEWFKLGDDLSGLPLRSYDPAAGEYFYSSNGCKVFVHQL